MSVRALGPKLVSAAVASVALGLWPSACTGHGGPPSVSSTNAAAQAPTPASLVPKTFLPAPSFAYAKGIDGSGMSIADVAEKAAPSVVNVSSSRTVKSVHEGMPFFFEDPFFQHFFGQGGPGQGPEHEERQKEHGLGSGVIVSADGIVLTNNHVVDDADEIKVTTADKHEYSVKVIGKDAKSDLAVLKLQGDVKGLHAIELADSSRLRLGDVVLAIGNPFGVGQTITMGIVSAKGRANVGIAAYEDFIQTDAAINPGNSGGALVDMEGKLVGINTAILSRTGGSMGIGFAIPSNMAQPIMKALLEHGKVVRGWLGVGIQDIDQDLAKAMNLATTRGVLISEVMDTGPAAKSGLKSGDVVLKLNGLDVESTGEFRNAVAAAGSGSTVKLDVLRDGKTVSIDAKLGELPEKMEASGGANPGASPGSLDGLTLEDLNPALRQKLDVPASVKSGVVVTGIDPGSPAAESGLRPGDVIVELNRSPVTNANAFQLSYTKAKDRALLRVVRGGRMLYIVVKR